MALAVIAAIGFLAIEAVFAPWIYVVGGKHRLLPVWAGEGEAIGPGGRYHVWVWFWPTPNRSQMLPGARVQGAGYVCTPRGEGFQLRVSGGASGRIWNDMDGHSFRLAAYHRPVLYNFVRYEDWRPSLSFIGRWVGPDLVMTDDASFAHAFRADGSLDTSSRGGWYPKTTAVPITLKETGLRLFAPKCQAAPR